MSARAPGGRRPTPDERGWLVRLRPSRRDARAKHRNGAVGAAAADASPASLDGGVLLAAVVLVFLGVVMSYSTTAPLALDHAVPPLFLDHVVALSVALLCATLAYWAPARLWRKGAIPLWAIALVLLALTLPFGIDANGARRWLALPMLPLAFQPAEIAKLATLLAVAAVVSRRDRHDELHLRQVLIATGLALPPIGLLLLQPDFGNGVMLGALVVLLLVAAGIRLRLLVAPALAAAIGIAAYVATHPYASRRVVGFLDPWADSQGSGFQLVQSFVAFSQGGLLGVGLGAGRQKLFYLPEAHTDFVLALVAEELGLVGVLVVLGAFAALLVAGLRIARRSRDRFSLLAAFAMTLLLTIPALVNAAVVMGLLPTKGLTLPFLSHGGTSLVICGAALGLLLGIARQPEPDAAPSVTGANLRKLAWR